MATKNIFDDPISFVCKICDEIYQHNDGPLMLPCLHSFCKPCLIKYINKEESNKMSCPTCNNQFPLPKDVGQFPVNLHLSHLAKIAKYENQAEKGNVKCQKCKVNPKNAAAFSCNRCMFLCDDCKSNYQEYAGDNDEEFIILATYKKGEFKFNSPSVKCPHHKKYDLELFCDDCKALICLYCSQTEHQNHEKSSIDITAKKGKAELQKLTNGVDDALDAVDQTIQQIQDTKDRVKVSAKEATNKIDKACDELIQAVENRREFLKRKCQEIAEGKNDVLSDQMTEVQCLKRNVSFAYLQANDTISNHSPEEILSIKNAIEVRLIQVMEAYQQQSMEVGEDGKINASVEIGSLVKEIQMAGSFPSVPDPSKCHIKGMAAVTIVALGEKKKMIVVLKDDAEKLVEGKFYFQYHLKKVGEDPNEYFPPKVTVTQSSYHNGTATLEFTTDQPGEYELSIMVRNRPIANPCKIVVASQQLKSHYSHFQNMQVTYKNVGGACYGVAVHDNGTMYATNYSGHTIKVFKPDGTESEIGSSDIAGGQLAYPQGITLIDDTIYVVSNGNRFVKVYSTVGKYIGGFGGYGSGNGQLRGPSGICTDGKGRLFVADTSNNRIQIFTPKGTFIKSIQCSHQPHDVAVDPMGHVHVALNSSHHQIVVYSEDGIKIESYNLGGKLRSPTGIYIDSEGNRLIGTAGNNRVHIADSTGALIATRQVDGSCGVAMDKSGLIYAAESNNNRVSVYY